MGKSQRIVVAAADREKDFLNDYIYLCLLSYTGISIEVTARFQEEDKEAAQLKKQAEEEKMKNEEDLFHNIPELPPPRNDFLYNNIARVKVWREFSTEVKRNRMNISFER